VSASVDIAIGDTGDTANELLRSAGTYGFEALFAGRVPSAVEYPPIDSCRSPSGNEWLLRTSSCNPSSSAAAA
jgi:hypothetical protein